LKNIKVGLVLSGGGARGLAHLGVLSVLEEHGVVVDLVVGASFGSIVAGYYGMGCTVDDIKKKAAEYEMMITQQDIRLRHWFFVGQKAEEFFRRDFGDTRIEELRLPVFILTIDLTSSEMYVFKEGPIVPAMRASSSFPGLFEPLLWKGHRYIDGGILNSMMLKVAKDSGADLIIFSDVSVFGVVYRKTLADFLIEPSVKKMRPLDFHKIEEAFTRGREAGYAHIDGIIDAVCTLQQDRT